MIVICLLANKIYCIITFFLIKLSFCFSSLSALTSSPDELTAWSPLPTDALEAMTIEELRDQLHCCFTCGVSWADSHVSLDCSECGGYAMERPCIKCEGECGQRWRRDLSMVGTYTSDI